MRVDDVVNGVCARKIATWSDDYWRWLRRNWLWDRKIAEIYQMNTGVMQVDTWVVRELKRELRDG